LLLATAGGGSGYAQSSGDIQIIIPPQIRIPAAAESPLPIRIAARTATPKRAMILIRGLPASAALSVGRLFESGVWGVPVAEIDGLRIASPAEAIGKTDFSVSVVTFSGEVLAEAKSTLFIVSPQAIAKSQPVQRPSAPEVAVVSATPTQPTTAEQGGLSSGADEPRPRGRAPLSGDALERVTMFIARGEESMKQGNLNVARLFFTRAANEGSPEAAFALATTYDPAEIATLPVAGGARADAELARKWYQKAAELGSQEASARLRRLSQR
jgi:hypothetical protein